MPSRVQTTPQYHPQSHKQQRKVEPYSEETLRISEICATYLDYAYPPTKATTHGPTLHPFIAHIIHSTRLPPSVASAALILLQRLRLRLGSRKPKYIYPSSSSSSSTTSSSSSSSSLPTTKLSLPSSLVSVHPSLLFLAAYIHAAQEHCLPGSAVFHRTYWANLAELSPRHIGSLQRRFCNALGGNVRVYPSYAALLENMHGPFSVGGVRVWGKEERTDEWPMDDDEDEDGDCDDGEGQTCGQCMAPNIWETDRLREDDIWDDTYEGEDDDSEDDSLESWASSHSYSNTQIIHESRDSLNTRSVKARLASLLKFSP